MLRLRPFRAPDAKTIITWTSEPAEFYKWSAGILGDYPVSEKRLLEAASGRENNVQYFPMTAFDVYGAEEAGLDVFDSNMQAYNCYKGIGFKETGRREVCEVGGYTWTYIEMVIKSEANKSNE